MKLTTQLFIYVMISLAAVIVPASLYQMFTLLNSSYVQIRAEHERVLKSFSSPVADALWALDNNYIKQLATSIILNEATTRVEIYDEDLNIFTSTSKDPRHGVITEDHEGKLLDATELQKLKLSANHKYYQEIPRTLARLAVPIFSTRGLGAEPSFHGILAVEYSFQSINSQIISRITQSAVGILLFTLLVSMIVLLSLRGSVLKPLFILLKAMQDMPSDRSVRVDTGVPHTYEFTQIFRTFNNMAVNLEEKEKLINDQRQKMIQSSKMSALGEMAAGIAHEINNPLAIIVGYSHILREMVKREQFSKPELLRNLNKITETTDRISKIIQGLKSFSRNSTGDARKWSSLAVIVENTLEFCAQRFKNNGIDLILGSVPNIEIFCRDSQIIQVLLNLLNNAFDAIQDDGDNRWIRLGFEISNGHLSVSVTDSGGGIPEDVAGKVMQPFFTTKSVGQGTGLGLSISKGIIEEHGGTLRLSENVKNTQFILDFSSEFFRLAKLDEISTAT